MDGGPHQSTPSGPGVHEPSHDSLLGTVVEIRIEGADPETAAEAVRRAVAEVERLEGVFRASDEGSELCRWRRGAVDAPSVELTLAHELRGRRWAISAGHRHP